jgi:FKBP-type peptidyl-prolyl cis-trans isomerase FklB
MKTTSLLLSLSLIICASILSCGSGLSSDNEKYSFALGHQIGENMKRQEIDLQLDAFKAGVAEGMEGVSEKMTPRERVEALKIMTEMLNKRAAEKKGEGGEEKK